MKQDYFENIPLHLAQERYFPLFPFEPKIEVVPVIESLGRITAEQILARTSMPAFHASAMDGVAVKARNTLSAGKDAPLKLRLHQDYEVVDTGDPIPEQFDSVIMVEYIEQIDEQTIEITEPAVPWKHIRPIGEDILAGEMILAAYHKIRPVDQGALLAGGIFEVPVLAKPKVAIIPTGTELVQPTTVLKQGDIIEFNGTVFAGYIKKWGGRPIYKCIVKDDYQLIKIAVEEALQEADIILMNAGSSLGREDFTSKVIEAVGELILHGVATRPGKPVVLGKSTNGKPIIGVPGYPVSAYLALDWFVKPLMEQFLHQPERLRDKLEVKLGQQIKAKEDAEDFIRVNIGKVNGEYIANPLTRAAGVTMSMVRADGLLRIPIGSKGYKEGERVEIELYTPKDKIDKTIIYVGSHDLTIDLLANRLKKADKGVSFAASYIGSQAGLAGISRGISHIAGVNLHDPKTGEYNIPDIIHYFNNQSLIMINLLYREQGWLVQRGNPKQIRAVKDLANHGVRYINRQTGSGTRVLFDYLLSENNISPDEIYGYSREDNSHLSVAAAIAGGTADAGLGIKAGADIMGLDFVPVKEERFDLVMTKEFYESDLGKVLLKAINSAEFKSAVEKMAGYSCRDTGKVIFER